MAAPARRISLVLLGKRGVGKSAFILRFTNDIFGPENAPSTHCEGDIEVDGKEWHLKSLEAGLDKAWEKRVVGFLKSSRGLLLLFAVDERASFECAKRWAEEASTKRGYEFPVLLVATKSDIPSDRVQVKAEEAQEFADSQGFSFVETSAASSSQSIRDAYASIIRSIDLLPPPSTNETSSLGKSAKNEEKCVIF